MVNNYLKVSRKQLNTYITTCGIKVRYHKISMNEKLIVNALIKVASVFQFYAKLYRYSQRNISALADNEVKTERVESCMNTQSQCFGVYELK